MKIKYLSILIAGLMLIGIPGMAYSTSITNTFIGTVASGPFTGYEGTGSFTYDDALLSSGDESLYPSDELMVSLLFDGQTFNETNDTNYSILPALHFSSFAPYFLDLVLDDGQNGVAFNNPNLMSLSLDNLTPLINGTFALLDNGFHEFEVLISATSYEPVPEPATMLLLGTGLVGVAGAARRKKKNQA